MKALTWLIALSAVLSAPALALEALDDEALADTLGRDGLTITLDPADAYTFSTILHDSDGFSGFTTPGAFVLGNPLGAGATGHTPTSIDPGANPITILIDATGDIDSGTAGSQASLSINVTLPANTIIHTGTLSIARSNGTGTSITNQSSVILNDMTITLPGTTVLAMTLGNEAADGQMMRLTTNMTNGLTISNFAIRDATATDANGYAIRADSIAVTNAGGTNLDVDLKIDAASTGLVTTFTQLGSDTNGMDIKMNNLRLGNSTSNSMGNLHILGLNMNDATLRISGH